MQAFLAKLLRPAFKPTTLAVVQLRCACQTFQFFLCVCVFADKCGWNWWCSASAWECLNCNVIHNHDSALGTIYICISIYVCMHNQKRLKTMRKKMCVVIHLLYFPDSLDTANLLLISSRSRNHPNICCQCFAILHSSKVELKGVFGKNLRLNHNYANCQTGLNRDVVYRIICPSCLVLHVCKYDASSHHCWDCPALCLQ